MFTTFLKRMRSNINSKVVALLFFYFLYRFVNVGFSAVVVYHAYSIVHSIWGSALAVLVLTLGASIGLLLTGLYVLYKMKPQVLALSLMLFRGALLIALFLLNELAESLVMLLLILVVYSTALWIERSIIGGIAIENVPSIARGLNILGLASRLGGILAAACLVLLLGMKTWAFAILALLHALLIVTLFSLLGKLKFKVTVSQKGSMELIFSSEAASLYVLMFILNVPISVLSSIAPSFGATTYALFYMASELSTVAGQAAFIIMGDRVMLSSYMLFYGIILGFLLTLIAFVCNVPLALITSVVILCFASTAGTVFVGNAIKYVFTDTIYNIKTILNVASLLGAMLGSLILLSPISSIVLTAVFVASTSSSPIIYYKMRRIGIAILQKREDLAIRCKP